MNDCLTPQRRPVDSLQAAADAEGRHGHARPADRQVPVPRQGWVGVPQDRPRSAGRRAGGGAPSEAGAPPRSDRQTAGAHGAVVGAAEKKSDSKRASRSQGRGRLEFEPRALVALI